MTYLALAVILAAAAVLVVLFLRDVLRCIEQANLRSESAAAGRCHCTRHRLCAVCLAELRSERSTA